MENKRKSLNGKQPQKQSFGSNINHRNDMRGEDLYGYILRPGKFTSYGPSSSCDLNWESDIVVIYAPYSSSVFIKMKSIMEGYGIRVVTVRDIIDNEFPSVEHFDGYTTTIIDGRRVDYNSIRGIFRFADVLNEPASIVCHSTFYNYAYMVITVNSLLGLYKKLSSRGVCEPTWPTSTAYDRVVNENGTAVENVANANWGFNANDWGSKIQRALDDWANPNTPTHNIEEPKWRTGDTRPPFETVFGKEPVKEPNIKYMTDVTIFRYTDKDSLIEVANGIAEFIGDSELLFSDVIVKGDVTERTVVVRRIKDMNKDDRMDEKSDLKEVGDLI